MNERYLIVAGTEKSGTTSIYQYLRAHPAVVASTRKETDYFRSPPPHALAAYSALFQPGDSGRVWMEASPGYLAESDKAAPAIAALIPDARLLFILRDPIDRLLSSFEFHKSRFFIPEGLPLDEYVDLCLRYERGVLAKEQTGLEDWFLRVLDAGRYARHLRDYERHFKAEQIKVKTLDDLQRDPRGFMQEVAEWSGLDAGFYDAYEFARANVTFSPRRAWLQRLGLWVNGALEPFFNRHPAVKSRLLSWYKTLNGRQQAKPIMAADTAALLIEYYRPDVDELAARYASAAPAARQWLNKHRPAQDGLSGAAAMSR